MQKLTKSQQMQLLQDYATTRIPLKELAIQYSITQRRVEQIVRGVRRNRDLKGETVEWSEAATKETEGGNQRFYRAYKQYMYYSNDDFWKEARSRPNTSEE